MKRLWKNGKALWAEFSSVGANTHASSISFFTFLSVVPLLALCVSLISLAGIDDQEFASFLCKLLPDALHGFVATLVKDAFARSGVVISLSTIVLLWSASKGMKALRRGLNAAYSVEENRGAFLIALRSIVAVLILGVLLAAVMCLIFSGCILDVLSMLFPDAQVQKGILTVVDLVVAFALGTFGLAGCYAFLPAEKRRYLAQLPGAVCATLACGMFSFGFHIYIDCFSNYNAFYGSIATVAIFLFWMYLIFYIILAGGFINHYLETHSKECDENRLQ